VAVLEVESVLRHVGHAARAPGEPQDDVVGRSWAIGSASRPDSKGRREAAFRIEQESSRKEKVEKTADAQAMPPAGGHPKNVFTFWCHPQASCAWGCLHGQAYSV